MMVASDGTYQTYHVYHLAYRASDQSWSVRIPWFLGENGTPAHGGPEVPPVADSFWELRPSRSAEPLNPRCLGEPASWADCLCAKGPAPAGRLVPGFRLGCARGEPSEPFQPEGSVSAPQRSRLLNPLTSGVTS